MTLIIDCVKKGPFQWTPKTFSALGRLKRECHLHPSLLLRHHDFSKVFKVACDASGFGIGGVLSQGSHLIAFF